MPIQQLQLEWVVTVSKHITVVEITFPHSDPLRVSFLLGPPPFPSFPMMCTVQTLLPPCHVIACVSHKTRVPPADELAVSENTLFKSSYLRPLTWREGDCRTLDMVTYVGKGGA